MPKIYQTDLVIDRRTLREWRSVPGMRLLWVLRENGTHFIPLDLDWPRREAKAVLRAFEPEFKRKDGQAKVAIVDATDGTVRETSYGQAGKMLDKLPRYRIDNARRVILDEQDQVVGGIQLNGAWQHVATVTVLAKGSISA